ncbi:unnamed protein product [Clonostachys solani]|uniref:OTU domain-containing protein n=1 Tax=Clonostachys solani TaxID=160281 RepID=A0A9N9ZD41_9HYPO|nr:unnamed protein product [Clonostachys solani]
MEGVETLEQVQARHRKELKDLQGKMTSKKKNATKKTRKGVNDECAEMERSTRERHAAEVAALTTGVGGDADGEIADGDNEESRLEKLEKLEGKLEEVLEKATGNLHITPPPTTTDGQPSENNNNGGGKKRNRQKERLARRAAEQEAAAVRAEEEAGGMTDHRALESEYMKKTFEASGLVEKEIAPDGHCLFSAVADQLRQNDVSLGEGEGEPEYKAVRRAASSYMVENADDFAPFLEEDLGPYAAKMRDTAEWGGQLELMALARRYGVEIRVIQDGRTEKIGEEEGKASGKTIWLAYYRHGYGLGEHYNSLRKTT